MKKLLLLFIFGVLGFIVKSQELEELYITETLFIKDSNLIAVTYGDTILTIEEARLLFTGGGAVSFGSEYQIPATNATTDDFNYSAGLTYNDSLNVSGNIIGDTIKANGGLSLDLINNNRFDLFGTDESSIYAGGKRLISFKENVTEQVIINPDGDLTGTATAPSLALGDGDTGFYERSDDVIGIAVSGGKSWEISGGHFQAAAQAGRVQINNESSSSTNPIYSFQSDLGTGIGRASVGQLSLIANSIEAMRLTEDTVFVDSTIAPLQIKFPDGTIQTTAATGDFTGVMQVVKAEVLFSNVAQTTIITLPANSIVWDVGLITTVLFDGSGTDILNIGITGTSNRYTSQSVAATFNIINGSINDVLGVSDIPDNITGSTNITFQYVDQNSDATQGTAYIYIHYTLH